MIKHPLKIAVEIAVIAAIITVSCWANYIRGYKEGYKEGARYATDLAAKRIEDWFGTNTVNDNGTARVKQITFEK